MQHAHSVGGWTLQQHVQNVERPPSSVLPPCPCHCHQNRNQEVRTPEEGLLSLPTHAGPNYSTAAGSRSRQFTDPWSDTLPLSGLGTTEVGFWSSEFPAGLPPAYNAVYCSNLSFSLNLQGILLLIFFWFSFEVRDFLGCLWQLHLQDVCGRLGWFETCFFRCRV